MQPLDCAQRIQQQVSRKTVDPCLDKGTGDILCNVQSPKTRAPSRCFSNILLLLTQLTFFLFSFRTQLNVTSERPSLAIAWTQTFLYLPRAISPQMLEQVLWFYTFYFMMNVQWIHGKGNDKWQNLHVQIKKKQMSILEGLIPIKKILFSNAGERLVWNNRN